MLEILGYLTSSEGKLVFFVSVHMAIVFEQVLTAVWDLATLLLLLHFPLSYSTLQMGTLWSVTDKRREALGRRLVWLTLVYGTAGSGLDLHLVGQALCWGHGCHFAPGSLAQA